MSDPLRDVMRLTQAFSFQDRYASAFAELGRLPFGNTFLLRQAAFLSGIQTSITSAKPITADLIPPRIFQALQNIGRVSESIGGFATVADIERGLKVHPSWERNLATIGAVEGNQPSGAICLGLSATRLSQLTTLNRSRLLGLDWGRLGADLGLSTTGRGAITSRFAGLTRSYEGLLGELERFRVLGLPEVVAAFPPVEVHRAVNILEVITPQEEEHYAFCEELNGELAEEAGASLPGLLDAYVPAVLSMWRGARSAIASTNPDNGRHVTVSLREALGHVLHALAPDEMVKAWTQDPKHFDRGRPTRRARLLYICRGVDCESFARFVEADVNAAIAFLDLLNRETHRAGPPLHERHLKVIFARAEGLLLFLLSIHEEGGC